MKIFLIITVLLIIPVSNYLSYPCTVFYASNDKYTIAGNNEDWTDPASKMFFYPAKNGKFGWVKFGWGSGFPQGGMNENGLFWDATACCYLDMLESEANKEKYNGALMGKIIEECGSVKEALDIFSNYYCQDQYNAQYLIGDRFGSSVIVEGDSYVFKNKKYQVMTNFYQSYPDLCGYPCWRFETATEMLENNELSLYLFGSILSATHQERKYPTQYSNIFDLKDCIIYLFHKHNFEEFIKIDLKKELLKGYREFELSSLFSNIEIVGPKSNEVVNQNEVILKWKGRSDRNYDLYISDDPDFTNCIPINIRSKKIISFNQNLLNVNGAFIGFLFFGSFISLRKKFVSFLIIIILLLIITSNCAPTINNTPDSNNDIIEYSESISNLQPETKYYWKIKTSEQQNYSFISETVNMTFITGDY